MGLFLLASSAAGGSSAVAEEAPKPNVLLAARPTKALSPPEVIQIQLAALAHNQALGDDLGILVAWRFASPANREQTGPELRFRQMLKAGYGAMLDHRRSSLGKLQITAVQAKQLVLLEDAAGQVHAYVWMLGLQEQGPYRGCWMTDAVIELELAPEGQQDEEADERGNTII